MKTNIQKISLCFLAHFLKQTKLNSVFVGEGQSARVCECWSSGAVPLSSSPHLKQIYHIRFVMSSHPAREKRFKRLFLLYFTGPMSHGLHFFPQLDAKYGCEAGVLAVSAWSQVKLMNTLQCAEKVRPYLLPSSSISTLPFGNSVPKCLGPAKSPSSSPPPPISSTISTPLPPTHLLFHFFVMDDMSPFGFSCPQ